MKKLNIHYFQHVSCEDPGTILEWALDRGHNLTSTKFYENEKIPDVSQTDWLIIMGGPMNIYEEALYPWLVEEKKFIKLAIDSGKTVIGICLGSQLIAEALGARVFKNDEKEIGWFDIKVSSIAIAGKIFKGAEESLNVFHWHGDTFDLPANSTHLASSEGCRNQGFIYRDRVLAMQFHCETTEDLIRKMLENGRDDLTPGKYVQTAADILSKKEMFESNKYIMYTILDRMQQSPE
jgi:GMP synthase-like glutamine amidotransferase